MKTRYAWNLTVALSSLSLGCGQPNKAEQLEPSRVKVKAPVEMQSKSVKPKASSGIIGYYKLDDASFYQAESMSQVPSGRVMYLSIEQNKWLMRDMMVGFAGTWREEKNGPVLTMSEGPSGNVSSKETFTVQATTTGVALTTGKKDGPTLRFTYVGPTAPQDFGSPKSLRPKK